MARHPRPFHLALAVAMASALMTASLVPATAEPNPAEPDPVELVRVSAAGEDRQALADLLSGTGYDLVGREGDDLIVLGDRTTVDELTAQGLSVVGREPAVSSAVPLAESATPLPARLAGQQYPTFYGGYRTVEGHYQFAEDLAEAYPELVRHLTYGESWERTRDAGAGYELPVLCVTADAGAGCVPEPDSEKPRFLLMAQIHAREVTTSEIAWRFVTSLVDGYGRDAEITSVLDSTEIWVVPNANPDGTALVERGIEDQGLGGTSPAWQRKNTNDSDSTVPCGTGGSWSNNHAGVDLNRNWDTRWAESGSSSNPCGQTYHGSGPNSEPETHQLADLFDRLFPAQRTEPDGSAPLDARGVLITLHTFGDYVLFPWGNAVDGPAPNDEGLRSLGFRMSHYNGYRTGRPPEVLYGVSGATDDYSYDRLGVASFTYELGSARTCTGFHPAYSCQDQLWGENADALLYAAKSARAPYSLALGPTVSDLSVVRANGPWASVFGTADDDAYGTNGVGRPTAQDVVAAEAYVGALPWEGGTPQPLRVVGSGSTVGLAGTFATTGLGADRQLIHVRAQDSEGNWGPFTAVWLDPA
ncbi:M14 family zinc carboxypeptidase [Actinoalloteichus spitiensis]|uniref:M14 family zinc carboxypeptidase n=1 Tax=Actinoalloteichus spitiensis TaxID=252394 RepID=UPI0012F65EDA|nr:M14 family zinc carboxypeptidase [Actinoalloteichus spitiensis]